MQPFHGIASRRLRLKWLVLGSLFVVFVILAILVGLVPAIKGTKKQDGTLWFYSLLIMAIYFAGAFTANYCVNKYLSRFYRFGHFALSVICRAENNRLYLKHGIEMRPGFNGLWVSFEIYKDLNINEYIENAKKRFLQPAIDYRQRVFSESIAKNQSVILEQQKI